MNRRLNSINFYGLIGLIFLLFSIPKSDEEGSPPPQNTKPKHVILLIADDYGVVSAEAYADLWDSARVAPTPNINSICSKGVRFQEAWSNPSCSPTRATLLTGRFGFRTGMGFVIPVSDDIDIDEPTLPRLIDTDLPGYALANIGKWHLGTGAELQGNLAPNVMGWPYYAGSLQGQLSSYDEWLRTENGATSISTTYATTQNVDDAIAFLDGRDKDQPFVLWMAFNAPHSPYHLPPAELHSYDDLSGSPEDILQNPLPYFEAMVEALDTEIGRLLSHIPDTDGDGLPDDTMVVFLGDNGSLSNILPMPYTGLPGKGSLYRHGIQVPLCIAGAGVQQGGRDIPHPVNIIDVHATVIDMLGVDSDASEVVTDSNSLRPYLEEARKNRLPGGKSMFGRMQGLIGSLVNRKSLEESAKGYATARRRARVFTEQFFPDDFASTPRGSTAPGATISNGRHKLIRFETLDSFREECYDLKNDPREESDLLSQSNASQNDLLPCNWLRKELLKEVCSEPDGAWSAWCE